MKKLFLLFSMGVMLAAISCGLFDSEDATNKLYVFSNTTQKFYLLDYKTFEVVKEIPVNISDSVEIYGMKLSTNRDFLIFHTSSKYPKVPPFGFALYDIKQEEFLPIYFTQIPDSGTVAFSPAQDPSTPGLVYVHFRDYGTYSVNLFDDRSSAELISQEHSFTLSKLFSVSPNREWVVINKKWILSEGTIHELEFYKANSNFDTPSFTLNEGSGDSVSFYDFRFSAGIEELFVSFFFPKNEYLYSNFGSYDLETKNLTVSDLRFPWSLAPYYMEYSAKRDEIYIVGEYPQIHVIDANSYEQKGLIELPGKTYAAPSGMLVSPEEDIAFVISPANNLLQVINLNNHKVIKSIELIQPTQMVIP